MNRCLTVHPTGLRVLAQCILTRSTLVKVKSGPPTAPGVLYVQSTKLPEGILSLRRNRSIGQRHPNLLPLPLQLPLLLQPQPCRLFLQHHRDACLMSAYLGSIPRRLHQLTSEWQIQPITRPPSPVIHTNLILSPPNPRLINVHLTQILH